MLTPLVPFSCLPVATPAQSRADTVPREWTVGLQIDAGSTSENARLNFNGHSRGDATITVPVGATVHVDFRNLDPAERHSVGVDRRAPRFPLRLDPPEPAFPGAISAQATSSAVPPGHSATLTFTATTPGTFSIVCYVPGHAAAGQWLRFEVVSTRQMRRGAAMRSIRSGAAYLTERPRPASCTARRGLSRRLARPARIATAQAAGMDRTAAESVSKMHRCNLLSAWAYLQ